MVGDGVISLRHHGHATSYQYDVSDHIKKGIIPRRNFEDFPRAFLLAFQIMTGDDWVNQMDDHLFVFNDWAPFLFFGSIFRSQVTREKLARCGQYRLTGWCACRAQYLQLHPALAVRGSDP
jgi:hypothetical protein